MTDATGETDVTAETGETDVTAETGATDAAGQEPTPAERRALFRVVSGSPDDAELAALAAVVAAAASAGHDRTPPRAPDLWASPAARLRAPLSAGPGAWRASGLPR